MRARDVALRAGAAPHGPGPARATDLFLDGIAANYNDGYAAGVPFLRDGLAIFGHGMSVDEELRWLWMACNAAIHAWDDDRWYRLAERHVELARAHGALGELPLALSSRAYALLCSGDLSGAAALIERGRRSPR